MNNFSTELKNLVNEAAEYYANQYCDRFDSHQEALTRALEVVSIGAHIVSLSEEGARINAEFLNKVESLGLDHEDFNDYLEIEKVASEFKVVNDAPWGTYRISINPEGSAFYVHYKTSDGEFAGGYSVTLGCENSIKQRLIRWCNENIGHMVY